MNSRASWDSKYRSAQRSILEPDPFLAESKPYLPRKVSGVARAADIAGGSGRHALRLAQWGLQTVVIDYSPEALRLCEDGARTWGCSLATLCLDLEAADIDLGNQTFDLITVFNYLHRPLVPVLRRCLRPGGVVVYKTYTLAQLRFGTGPRNPDHLLRAGELREMFSGFDQIVYRETCESEATAALIAQRPLF